MESYVNLLLQEIEKRSIFYRDRIVISVFLGGGTPSLLPAEETGRILERIAACFSLAEDAEVTIECNPGTVTAEKLQHYITHGINRLSIGLQSMDDRELARIGRIHGRASFLATYRMAREAGFSNINIDLMAGLPGQSLASYRKTLEQAAALKPEHISAYSLILEEGTPLYVNQNDYTFPDEEEDREMYALTGRYLEQSGYHRYEISNYAMPGQECRHNKVYWQRGDYVGLGLGASSMVADLRWKNPEEAEAYRVCVERMEGIQRAEPGSAAFRDMLKDTGHVEVQALTTAEQMEEFMFLGLRLTEGIQTEAFRRTFGRSVEGVYGEVISRFTAQGLLERTGGYLRLTPGGVDVSNVVFAEFLF